MCVFHAKNDRQDCDNSEIILTACRYCMGLSGYTKIFLVKTQMETKCKSRFLKKLKTLMFSI